MIDKDNALAEGLYLRERYVIKGILGRGGFGFTYEAYDEAMGKKCAIKEYFPKDAAMRLPDRRTLYQMSDAAEANYRDGMIRFNEEAQVLWKLQGVQSVVSVYDYFNENNTCYFVMDFIDGVTLKQLVKEKGKLDYNVVKAIFLDVGMGLTQVHGMGVFHRDIKPDNIMLEAVTGKAKIIDFGNAENIKRESGKEHYRMLTEYFAPPEQYKADSEQGTFTDVYAFASTIFYALTGNYLPKPQDRYESGENINLEQVGFPKNVSDALNKALKLDYKERTQTIYELLLELNWFADDWNTIEYHDHKENEEVDGEKSENGDWKKQYVDEKNLDNQPKKLVFDDSKREPKKPPMRIPHPYMVIVSGDNAGTTVDIPVDRGLVVGRTRNYAQVIFEQDEFISKKHCEVYYDSIEDALYVTDYSTNGTWVNGYRLNRNQVYAVEKGSMVVLANQKCSFKVGVTYQ